MSEEHNMKGNRLSSCRKAVCRVAVSMVLPFFRTTIVERSDRQKYIVGDVLGKNLNDYVNERVVTTEDWAYRGSYHYDSKVSPMTDQTWTYLMHINDDSLPDQAQRYATVNEAHIGNICKDYGIFQVAYCGVEVTPVHDESSGVLLEKSSRQSSIDDSRYTNSPKGVHKEFSKHIGNYCKDYAIFQVTNCN
ncbi:hypothetical protein ScPMuIL_010564 [Solemya velum]